MLEWLTLQSCALAVGFLIDFIIGDPHGLPHPVVGIGRMIAFLDGKLRRGDSCPKDVGRGVLTVVLVCLVSTILPTAVLVGCYLLHPIAYFCLDCIMCWQLLAARQLARESRAVQEALEKDDVEGARKAVSYIVGRDTDVLDATGICKAAVETVAENTSDGVIAPLFWMILLGASGGFFYKAVNTMDSMLGYKNEKYLYFGRAAAKTDDLVNWLPARISALLMILSCPLCSLDTANAIRVFRRDRFKHDSPNSAQTESVCAGALCVQLAGDAVYGGVVHKKEFIGDPIRMIEPKDISRANRLMYIASFFMLLIGLLIRMGVYFIIC